MTAPLLIHFEHLPPTGWLIVRVDGSTLRTIVRNREDALLLANLIGGGNFRIIDGLGPRQRRPQRRLPR